jgi:hypothetical protein
MPFYLSCPETLHQLEQLHLQRVVVQHGKCPTGSNNPQHQLVLLQPHAPQELALLHLSQALPALPLPPYYHLHLSKEEILCKLPRV